MPVNSVSTILTVHMKAHALKIPADIDKLLKATSFRDLLITQVSSNQQNTLSQAGYRPVVFFPAASEYGISGGQQKTTQKRSAKNSRRGQENTELGTTPATTRK